MRINDTSEGPKFVSLFGPTIEALKDLGGSGRPSEVKEWIVTHLKISQKELSEQIESGSSRFSKNVDWARFYLAKAGFIDASSRGVWNLTEKGLGTSLTHQDALAIFHEVQAIVKADNETTSESPIAQNQNDSNKSTEPEGETYRQNLLTTLLSLPPSGFERFCQRLLRESGFQEVIVTGRSGDGGLDGHGLLQINPLVSMHVYFQCKRYAGSVSPSTVRDFRGAMMGRADKGIILTTGSFTREAKKEAIRDGATPIELVDGDRLLAMLEQLKLGLLTKTIYEVDNDFFDEFRIDQ